MIEVHGCMRCYPRRDDLKTPKGGSFRAYRNLLSINRNWLPYYLDDGRPIFFRQKLTTPAKPLSQQLLGVLAYTSEHVAC